MFSLGNANIYIIKKVLFRIACNTQIYIQEETKVCKQIDPWGGSYYVESLTKQIAERAIKYSETFTGCFFGLFSPMLRI